MTPALFFMKGNFSFKYIEMETHGNEWHLESWVPHPQSANLDKVISQSPFSSRVYDSEMLTSICCRKPRTSPENWCSGSEGGLASKHTGCWPRRLVGQEPGRTGSRDAATASWIQNCELGGGQVWVKMGWGFSEQWCQVVAFATGHSFKLLLLLLLLSHFGHVQLCVIP